MHSQITIKRKQTKNNFMQKDLADSGEVFHPKVNVNKKPALAHSRAIAYEI